jgi:hypothetical protein
MAKEKKNGWKILKKNMTIKPKYKYEIKREKGSLPHPMSSTSFPEFREIADGFLDVLGDDSIIEDDTIVIRKIKNE